MFYVYTLRSKKNGQHYYGHTKNLERRLLEHNTNKDRSKFTCVNGPWELVFSKEFSSRVDAMRFEKFLKTGKSREYIKEQIKRFE